MMTSVTHPAPDTRRFFRGGLNTVTLCVAAERPRRAASDPPTELERAVSRAKRKLQGSLDPPGERPTLLAVGRGEGLSLKAIFSEEEEEEEPLGAVQAKGEEAPTIRKKKHLQVATTMTPLTRQAPTAVDVTRPADDNAVDAFLTFVGSSSPLGVTDPSFSNNLGGRETAAC